MMPRDVAHSERHMGCVNQAATRVSTEEHTRLTTRAARLSVLVASLLIMLKAWSWWSSASVGMLASLADSTLDLLASVVILLAVRYAAAPPDREHRFGHGKAEAFAGLIQAGIVGLSALFIGVESARRFIHPQPVTHVSESIVVMGVSIGLTIGLVTVQTQAARRTGSVATRADRLHYAGDIAANLAVLVGIGAGSVFNLSWADPAAALGVAAWLAWGATRIWREAADHLLDRELPDDQRARIQVLAEQDKRILRAHGLRTRTSGPYMHIQFHAELDPDISLVAAHEIVVAAEERIRAEFPTADIIIHADPKGRAQRHGHQDFERLA